jgi:glutamate-5-semialdehyde dehydrogenase
MIVIDSGVLAQLDKVKKVSRRLPQMTDEQIADILYQLADLTLAEQSFLLKENQKDLDRMDCQDPKYDRLLLTQKRLEHIANDLRQVAQLPSPLGITIEKKLLPNDLQLSRVTVPIGVIGIVYESRPNVTFDVFALCLKSGNASVLKGSRDAHFSNLAIQELIHQVLKQYDIRDACYLMPSEREVLPIILNATNHIDLIIPRGGQGLIQFVRENASVPVIETGAGIVHTYFDESGDITKGKSIIENAKARRVSVCNALDTLLIHEKRIEDLPMLVQALGEKHECEVLADEQAFAVLKGKYPDHLLQLATPKDFGTEFLAMKMSIKTVSSLATALEHIAEYSSKHSEAIIAEDEKTVEIFLKNVDAAVVYANASTSFTDGSQFGLGAEIGISTQKLHARGPMALRELTSYKWIVRGNGQIRN